MKKMKINIKLIFYLIKISSLINSSKNIQKKLNKKKILLTCITNCLLIITKNFKMKLKKKYSEFRLQYHRSKKKQTLKKRLFNKWFK